MRNKSEPWLWTLLINVAFAQASIYVMRPMITYHALENGASSYQIGLIAALYALVPLLIAVPMGRWVGRFGEVPLLVLGCFSFIALSLSFTRINNIAGIAAITSLAGIAHLSNVAASQSMVANRSSNERQDHNFGYFSFATSSGHTFGPILGGIIAGSTGALPRSSSSAFIFAAFLALIALLPFIANRKFHQPKSAQDRLIAENIRAREVLARPGIKPAVWASLAVSATNDVLIVLLPLLGSERNISPVVIGLILSLRSAAAMVSRFSLGRLTNRYGTYQVLNVSILVSTIVIVISIFARSSFTLALSMIIVGFALGIGQPLTMSIVSKKSPVEERAMAISIRLSGNRLGQFLVPLGSGAIAGAFGSGSAFLALALLVASGGIVSVSTSKEGTN